MCILFLILCYLKVYPIASYVLLAANMEDFHSLAKKLVPENIADQLFSITTQPSQNYVKYISSGEVRHKMLRDDDDSQTDEETINHKHKHLKVPHKRPLKSTTTNFELQIDDLVARVKESLQKDWSLFLTTKDVYNNDAEDYTATEINTHDGDNYKRQVYPMKKLQVRYIKQSRHDDRNKHREKDRYVEQQNYVERPAQDNYAEVTEQTPKHQQNDRQVAQATRFKKTHSRQVKPQRNINIISDIVTEDPTESAKETRFTKDDYEDTQNKDVSYYEKEPSKNGNDNKNVFVDSRLPYINKKRPMQHNNVNYNYKKVPEDHSDHDEKISNIFNEVDKAINNIYNKPPVRDQGETINYNKKKRMDRFHRKDTTFVTRYTPDADDDVYVTNAESTSQKSIFDMSDVQKNYQPHFVKKPQGRHVKQSKHQPEDRDSNSGPERYVEVHNGYNSEIVAAPSSVYLEPETQVGVPNHAAVQQRPRKQRIVQQNTQPEPKISVNHNNYNNGKNIIANAATEDELHIYKGIDMAKVKDSYEDYVTPKKDDNIYEDIHPMNNNKQKGNFKQPSVHPQRDLNDRDRKDDYYEETELNDKKTDVVDDNEYNYNKQRINVKVDNGRINVNRNRKIKRILRLNQNKPTQDMLPIPAFATDAEMLIPYADQIRDVGLNDGDFQNRAVDNIKMKAESLLLEDKVKEGTHTLEEIRNKYLG